MKPSLIVKRLPLFRSLYHRHLANCRKRERRDLAMSYYTPNLRRLDQWVDESREATNFTYELTPTSYLYMASAVAVVTRVPQETINRYVDEVLGSTELKEHVRDATLRARANIGSTSDPEMRLARRAGWYAVARATKPRVIVETGVDKGLGAVTLCAALRENAKEGYPGKYFGTDINPQAGWLLSGVYAEFGKILYGDSVESLTVFSEDIDLFINDSDHSSDYERREYDLIECKLSPDAIILGDNAHCNSELHEFSARTHRNFLYWQERPMNHWYPGGGIGFSFRDRLGSDPKNA